MSAQILFITDAELMNLMTAANKALVNVPSGLGRFQRPTILALSSIYE